MLWPWPETTAVGANHTGDRCPPLLKSTGAVSPAPGSQVAVATRGPGCDPLHSTQRQPLSLVSLALELCRASPSLSPAYGHTALRYRDHPVVLMLGDPEYLVSLWRSAS